MPSENLSGTTIEGYHLIELIGEGGTASVYRAEHPERGASAFKILKERLRADQTAVKRFLREAGYGSRVTHPSVVQTYDYGDHDGLYYLALEWAEGEPLSEFAERSGPLSPSLVAEILRQLADGLAAAHEVGIIHRDLKPENIIYDPQTHATKLLDFGIARDADSDPAERLTKTGFFVGTLNYVAPEALSGELVGEPADIYSLATITYYLLSGQHPYTGRSPRELFQQLLTQPPVPLNKAGMGHHFPDALQEVVMRALERDPASRQQTVRRFADEFAAAASAQSGAGPVPVAATTKEEPKQGLMGTFRSLFGKKG